MSEPGVRLTLVVGPAGSGKSTLLTHVAEACGRPVAWVTLDGAGVDNPTVLAHLRAALGDVITGLSAQWESADAALADLDRHLTDPVLLILDDLHQVRDQPLREVIGSFIQFPPERLGIILASRSTPELDLSRHRLAGGVVDVDADALRFRTWEVDELFRTCHQVQLPPDEVNTLTRRTAGWAAGLQLFHLATRRQPPSRRAALLHRGGAGSRLTKDYLAQHVLDRVGADTRAFLISTSVLDELTPRRCDALTERSDSAHMLAELERTGLFTFRVDDGSAYQYHDVLRSHLLDELVSRFGTETARALHQRAAALLAGEGRLVEAIRAHCRAEDWDQVRQLLRLQGESLAREPGQWIDLIPAALRDQDPWVLLALARNLLSDGALEPAIEMYQRAVRQFGEQGSGRAAVAELRMLQAWVNPQPGVHTDWVHLARAVLVDPRRNRSGLQHLGPVTGGLLHGFAELASGDLQKAEQVFGRLLADLPLSAAAETLALLGRAIIRALAGPDTDPTAGHVCEQAVEAAKLLGIPALTRLVHGVHAVAVGDPATVPYLVAECRRRGDRWGADLLDLVAQLAALRAGPVSAHRFQALAAEFRQLAAPAAAAWADAGAALAGSLSGTPSAYHGAPAIERAARAVGPLPYALALLAVSAATGRVSTADLARQVGRACGAGRLIDAIADRLPQQVPPAPAVRVHAPAVLHLRCLGGYTLSIGTQPLDLQRIRPRHRELLRLLSLHANQLVHRERIIEWLWPSREPDKGQHSLQVAISDLRKLLEPVPTQDGTARLQREDGGYRLVLDPADHCDVRELSRQLAAARQAVRRSDTETAIDHLETILALYAGDLLPEDGAAEWVVDERDRIRQEAAEACEQLAGLRAAAGAHAEAIRVVRFGLGLDRYRDGFWQQLVSSLRADGQPAAAAAEEAAYRQVLTEMGLAAEPVS